MENIFLNIYIFKYKIKNSKIKNVKMKNEKPKKCIMNSVQS